LSGCCDCNTNRNATKISSPESYRSPRAGLAEKLFIFKKYFLCGEKENLEEYFLNMASAERGSYKNNYYSTAKWQTCPWTTVIIYRIYCMNFTKKYSKPYP
jgi:hypothetical protein